MKPSKEIAELRECIEVIEFNLANNLHDHKEQQELKLLHLARIKELEKKCLTK